MIVASKRPEWKTDGLAVGLDALDFVLAVTDGVDGGGDGLIEVHRRAWSTGTRASDGAPQPPLDPDGGSGRAAARGERPNLRGVTGKAKGFEEGPDIVNLRPRAASAKNKSARATVAQPRRRPHLAQFLAKEAERGNEYLFVEGDVERDVDASLDALLNGLID